MENHQLKSKPDTSKCVCVCVCVVSFSINAYRATPGDTRFSGGTFHLWGRIVCFRLPFEDVFIGRAFATETVRPGARTNSFD